MRSDELLAAIRIQPFIGDAAEFPDYTDARLLIEMSDVLKSVFTGLVVDSRSGYWLQSATQVLSTTDARYRIPDRASAGGLETVEFQDASLKFRRLDKLPEDQALEFASIGAATGIPQFYVIRGDQLELLPTPSTAALLRISYYLRPSRLVQPQSSTLAPAPNNVDRGRITNVNAGTRQLTVNALPFDQELATPANITSALQLIDVIHPGGSYAPVLVGATQSIAALVITVGGTDSLADIQVGDYVRVAEQAEWPPIPEDYHRLVSDIASIKLMTQLNWADKAQLLSAATSGDIERFKKLLESRVKSQPQLEVADPLVSAVRLATGIKTDDEDYPVARILQELNDAQQSVFTDLFASVREGYWLRTMDVGVASATSDDRVQLPTRAASNGLENVSLGVGAIPTRFYPIIQSKTTESERQDFAGDPDGRPTNYVITGDMLRVIPRANQNFAVRFHYYARPSRIVAQQSSAAGGGTDRGRVTSVGGSTLNVNAVPFDMSLDAPVAITSALQRIDVVRPNGPYDAVIISATQTLAGNVFTIGGLNGQNLADVRVGDYVRVEDQTDWPALPKEYHRLVADAAAVKILTAKGEAERAQALAQVLSGDIGRLRSQLQSRVKDQRDQRLTQNPLVSAVRLAAGVGVLDEQYPTSRLFQELTDAVHTTICDIVLKVRAGFWLKSQAYTTTAGAPRYRIPDRACSTGLEAVEIALDGVNFAPLTEIPEEDAFAYESFGGTTNQPQFYVVRGDQIHLMPAPSAAFPLRMSFYIRPSTIYDQPITAGNPGNVTFALGRVSSFSIGARTITVNAIPADMALESPAQITTAVQLIDVIHPGGSYETVFFNAAQTISGTVFTITDPTIDMTGLAVGDYVRVAEQTDWPPVPKEYHRVIADLAAVRILRAKGDSKRAQTIESLLGGDLERFRSSLLPRVKSQPKTVPITLMSRGGGSWSRWR